MPVDANIDRVVDLRLRLPGEIDDTLAAGASTEISIGSLRSSLDTYAVYIEAAGLTANPSIELLIDGVVVPRPSGPLAENTALTSDALYTAGFVLSFTGAEADRLDVSGFDLGSALTVRITNNDPSVQVDLARVSVDAGLSFIDGAGEETVDLAPVTESDIGEAGRQAFTLTDLTEPVTSSTANAVGSALEVAGAGDQEAAILAQVSIEDAGADLAGLDWTFTAPLGLFDFLSDGETVTISRDFTTTVTRTFDVTTPGAEPGDPDVVTPTTTTDVVVETVAIQIVGRNDAPEVIDATFDIAEDTSFSEVLFGQTVAGVDPAGTLQIATDVDSDTLTFTLLDEPTLGRLVQSSETILIGDEFAAFTYVPNANANGTDIFRIEVRDTEGATTIQTVTVNVEAVNDAPVNLGTQLNRQTELVSDASVAVSLAGLRVADVEVEEAGGTLTVSFDTQGAGTVAFALPTDSGLTAGLASLIGTADDLNAFFAAAGEVIYTDTTGASPVIAVSVTDNGVSGTGGPQTTQLGTITVDLNQSPVADAKSISGAQNSAIFDEVTATDAEGDALTFTLASDGLPASGDVVMQSDGRFFYNPDSGFSGTDSFDFIVSDGQSSTRQSVSVSISAQNSGVTVVQTPIVMQEDRSITGTISVVNADGGVLTFSPVDGVTPELGTFDLNSDGSYTYTPDPDAFGDDEVFFTITGGSLSEPLTTSLPVTIQNVQDAPIAEPLSIAGIEDQITTGQLLATDVDGDDLTFAIVDGTGPLNGSVTINADGMFTYTPRPDLFGTDTFSYSVTDGLATATAMVTINVAGVNDAPVFENQAVTTLEDTAITRSLGILDIDSNPNDFVYTVIAAPAKGQVAVHDDGTYTYTPDANANGADSFDVSVVDGDQTVTATISVEITPVNDAPDAQDDSAFVREDRSVVIDLVANDTDPDSGDILRVIEVGEARNGTVSLSLNGIVVYTPDPDFFGDDGFGYVLGDGQGGTSEAQVSIKVKSQGEILVSGTDGDDVFNVRRYDAIDRAFDGGDGFDIVRNILKKKDFFLTDASFDGIEEIDGNGGRILVASDGQLDLSDVALIDVREILGDHGSETILGSQGDDIIDGFSGSDTLFGQDGDDTLIAGRGQEGSTLSGGAGNDILVSSAGRDLMLGGADDDVINVSGEKATGDTIDGGTGYDVLRNVRTSDIWLTDAVLSGIEEIDANGGRIRLKNNETLDLSSISTMTNVREIRGANRNETIVASGDDDRIDGSVGFDTVAYSGRIQNYEFSITDRGGATINGDATGHDRLDSIEAVVFDNYTLRLDGTNNPNVGFDDALTLTEDAAITLQATTLLDNDIDPDGDEVTVTAISSDDILVSLTDGVITVDPAGQFDDLAVGEVRVAVATYATEDERGAVGTGKVEISVTGENDAPVAERDAGATVESVPVSGSVLANDSDVDNGAQLLVSAVAGDAGNVGATVTLPSGAQITIRVDGTYTYDPLEVFQTLGLGVTTTDSVEYTVTDEYGATDSETLTVTITGDNDAVIAVDDAYDGQGRRALFVAEEDGLLINDSDIDIGDVPQVAGTVGGTTDTVFELIDGTLEEVTRYVATGDTGGRFAIRADGSFVFEAGTDFDDVARGETRATNVTYIVSDGKGATDEGTLTVTVGASASAPPPVSAPFDPSLAQSMTVAGTFDQLGSVDVLTALTTEGTDIDLNTLLDVNLFDIDTTFVAKRRPGEVELQISDNNTPEGSDPAPVLTGFGTKLQSAVDVLEDLPNPLDFPTGPLFAGPEFDLSATLKAQLNWDIDIASLGKTAFFQPASFNFNLPNAPVQAGAQYQLLTDAMISSAPTTAIETVGLGKLEVGVGYDLSEIKFSNVGISIGTQDFLGLDIDGLFYGRLGLQGEFDLTQTVADASPVPLAANFSFSAIDLLDGLATTGLSDFLAAVRGLATATEAETPEARKKLAAEIDRALTAIDEVTSVTFTVGEGDRAIDLRASQIVDRYDLARFNDYDGFEEDGTGYFVEEALGADAVRITRADLEAAMDANDITDSVAALRDVFGADGLEVIEGLTIRATLPIGNVEELEGFDGLNSAADTADREGPQTIEVEQVTRLFGVEVDFEKIAIGLAKNAVDEAIKKALLNPTPDTPKTLAASIGAKAALELAPEIIGFVEEGFSDTTAIQPVALVEAAFEPLFQVVRAIVDVVQDIPGADLVLGDLGSPAGTVLSLADEDGNLSQAALREFGDFLEAALTGLANLPANAISAISESASVSSLQSALSTLSNLNLGGVGGAFSTIIDLLGSYDVVPLSSLTNAIDSIARLTTTGVDQANAFGNAIGDFLGALSGLASSAASPITDGITDFVDFLLSAAEGFSVVIDAQFDLLDFTTDAGIDLVQIASFDPDAVSVTYASGGFEVDSTLGEVATFVAEGRPGDILEGEVTYNYSGEVDYDYRLRFEIEPILTYLQTQLEATLTLGTGAKQSVERLPLNYAAVKITDDYDLSELGNQTFSELIDEALVELPFGLVDEVRGLIFRQIQEQLNDFAADQSGLADNELRLFKVDNIALATDRFTEISEDFTVEITGIPVGPAAGFVFSEDDMLAIADAGLLDTIDGTLAGVSGDALSIGRLLKIFTGLDAEVLVTRDGTLVFNSNDAFENLAQGQTAATEFDFTVDDPDGTAVEYTATVTIEGRNDAPVAVADNATMTEDGVLRFAPLSNDTDVDDGAVLTLVSGQSAFGTVTVEAGETIIFTPFPDVFGAVTVEYVVRDEFGAVGNGTINVEIAGTPDDIVAVADVLDVAEDGKTTLDVRANDYEPDGQAITITDFTQPAAGTLALNDAGDLVFDGNGAFEALGVGATETLTATVTVSDGDSTSTADLTLIVQGANDAPVANDDSGFVREDHAVLLDLVANDTDVDLGDVLRVLAFGEAAHGRVDITPTGQVLYTPDPDFFGEDTFTYTTGDGQGGTAEATVRLTIKAQGEIPVNGTDGDDVFYIQRYEGIDRAFDGGDGFDIVRNKRPNGDFYLTDASFDAIEQIDGSGGRIRVGEGRLDLSEVDLVNVRSVFGTAAAQLIIGSQGDDIINGYRGSDTLFGEDGDDVLIAGSGSRSNDPDEDRVGSFLSGGEGDDTLTGGKDRDVLRGDAGDDVILVRGRDGEYDTIDGGDGYDVLRNNANGDFWLTGAHVDGIEEIDANGARIRIDRDGTLDLTQVLTMTQLREIRGSSGDDLILGSQDGETIISGTGDDIVRGQGGDDLLIASYGGGNNTLSGGKGNDTLVSGQRTDLLQGDEGDDIFLFKSKSGEYDRAEGGTGYDIVRNDSASNLWLTGIALDGIEEIDGNQKNIRVDRDGFLDLSSVGLMTDVLAIIGSSGDEIIIGSADDDLIKGSRGHDTVIYSGMVQDYDIRLANSGSAVIEGATTGRDVLRSIEVIQFDNYTLRADGTNNPSIGYEDFLSVTEDAAIVLPSAQLLANDFDPDGDEVIVTGVSSDGISITLANGQITLDPAGAFEALAKDETQTLSGSYTTIDARGAVGTGALSITVTGVNDAPVALADSNQTVEQVAVSGTVLANDTDVDNGAVLSVAAVSGSAANVGQPVTLLSGAQVTIFSDGTYTYDPLDAFASLGAGRMTTDSVTYTVTDEHGATDTQTLTVSITGDNDALTDGDESYSMVAGNAFSRDAATGLLANASDIDATDIPTIVGANGTPLAGSTGGQFLINPDGSFAFVAGRDFNDLNLGESRVSSLTYTVTDGNGLTDTSTVSINVGASPFDPFTDEEPRFDLFDPSDEAALVTRTVDGVFDQRQSIEVFTALAERATGSDVNLDTLFDIDLLSIDQSIALTLNADGAEVTQLSDNSGSGLMNDEINTAITAIDSALSVLTRPFGPIVATPTVTAVFDLDINVSLDIDLVTLGEAAFFQPIRIDLAAPEFAAANEAFILRSTNVRSLTPETAIQTVGLGSFVVNNSFDINDTTLSNLGYTIATNDFGGLPLKGLAEKTFVFNAEFKLADAIQATKDAIAAIVEDIQSLYDNELSQELNDLSPLDILDRLVDIDVNKLASGITGGTVDLAAIRARVNAQTGSDNPLEVVRQLVDELLEAGSATIEKYDVNGAALDARELFQMGQDAALNKFDGFLADGTGFFARQSENDPNTSVAVTEDDVEEVLEEQGITARVTEAVEELKAIAYEPFAGVTVSYALPVDNIETIAGFDPTDTNAFGAEVRTGLQDIEVLQETKLASLEIDFETVALSLIDELLENADDTPQTKSLKNYIEYAKLAQAAAEQGVEAELIVRPADLIVTALNGVLSAIDAAGNGLDEFVPGDFYSGLGRISKADTIEALDLAIDQTVGALLGSDGIGGAVDNVLNEVTNLPGIPELDAVLSTLRSSFSAIGILESGASAFSSVLQTARDALGTLNDFGFEVDLLFDTIEVYPFRGFLGEPIRLVDTALGAASTGIDAVTEAARIADALADTLAALTNASFSFGSLGDDLADGLKSLARGAELAAELTSDFVDAKLNADLSIVQRAIFDPDEVSVNYDVGGFDIDANINQGVGMYAIGDAGETITGTASYSFTGDVDYDYRLKVDIDPRINFFETSLAAEIFFGNTSADVDEAGNPVTPDYEGSDTFTFLSINDGAPREVVENALIDIEVDLTDALAAQLRTVFEDRLGNTVPSDVTLLDGEVFLFRVEDILLEEDDFGQVFDTFDITLL